MEFSLDRFYRLNRRVIIWIVLFALIYFLRDFFTLIFLTFITGFFSFPAIRFLMDRFHINRVAAVSLVHVGILLAFIGIVWTISPNLVGELATFQQNLDGYEEDIKNLRTPYEERYPNLVGLFESYVPDLDQSITEQRVKVEAYLPPVAGQLFTLGWTSLLAILFSFMITYDYVRLSRQVQSLRSSKLRDFYEEAGQPVVKFATSIGRGFQALVTIAFITTGMITVVMALFGLPSLALLALIVFLSSLIPVVGVIFELAAVGLVTLNQFGPDRTLWVLGTLLAIHVLVTYTITPLIFGRHFRLNLVLVLMILFFGERIFGIWGMILGVPVANYFIRDVFAIPFVEEKEPSPSSEKQPEIRPEEAPLPSQATPAGKA